MPAMEHAQNTHWDTMVEQLRQKIVPWLAAGTRDPTQNLNWMLVGFNVALLDYPASTQRFEQQDGTSFWSAATMNEASKCQLCLEAVPSTR